MNDSPVPPDDRRAEAKEPWRPRAGSEGPREVIRQVPREFRDRERLEDLRMSAAIEIVWRGHSFHVSVGFYDDGRPGEVFARRIGEDGLLGAMVDKYCIAVSHALQHGARLEELARFVTRDLFDEPESPMDAALLAAMSLAAGVEIRQPEIAP